METHAVRRSHPHALWPEAQSAILLGMNYGPDHDPLTLLRERDQGLVSAYASRRDYHDVIKGKLKEIGLWLARETGGEVKVFVDTAPLMEKPLAARAGLGWQGKHTNLVSRDFGSWLFLGAILTDAKLPINQPESDHCGQCRACLDVCPTQAFPAPYQLDARRCIAYLTIEHPGPIPHKFREAMGNRVFGCDDCLAVCPWNKFASVASEQKWAARMDLTLTELEVLAGLTDEAFRARFAGTPVRRTGRDRFLRNVAIAIGNSGALRLVPAALRLLDDPSPLVRGAAVWALKRLLGANEFATVRNQRTPGETDPAVREEWA
jgi:epoxyqueuosine reductase